MHVDGQIRFEYALYGRGNFLNVEKLCIVKYPDTGPKYKSEYFNFEGFLR